MWDARHATTCHPVIPVCGHWEDRGSYPRTGTITGVSSTRPRSEAYQALLSAVERGYYLPGTRLPSERLLAEQLGVSRATLRTALLRLSEEGVLRSSAQRGWFAATQPLAEPPSTLQSFSEMARARGLRPTARVLSLEKRAATLQESQRLRVAPASEVLELRRLRGMDATPVCVDRTVLPLPFAAPLMELDLEDASLYDVLRDHCGVEVRRSSYILQAQPASDEVAELLCIAPGSPVLVGRETTYADDGHPVNLGLAQYRGDAYEFQADLFRPVA